MKTRTLTEPIDIRRNYSNLSRGKRLNPVSYIPHKPVVRPCSSSSGWPPSVRSPSFSASGPLVAQGGRRASRTGDVRRLQVLSILDVAVRFDVAALMQFSAGRLSAQRRAGSRRAAVELKRKEPKLANSEQMKASRHIGD